MATVNEKVSKNISPKNDSNTVSKEATKVNMPGINQNTKRELIKEKIDDKVMKTKTNNKKDTKKGKNSKNTEAEGNNKQNNHKKGNKKITNIKPEGSKLTLGKKEEEKIAKKVKKIVKQVKNNMYQTDTHHNLYMK